MVVVGAEMMNVRSGERFVWRATAGSTGGEYCEFDLFLAADAKVPVAHRHPRQEERFAVLSGALNLTLSGRSRELVPGEVAVVPPATPHCWGNRGRLPSHVLVRLTPALRIEEFFAMYCRVATEGRAGRSGAPRNPVELAVMLDSFREEWAFGAEWQQRLLGPALSALATVGRRRGYRADPSD